MTAPVVALIASLESAGDWTLGPPQLVDEVVVIHGEPAETDESFQRRKRVASIVAEGAQNIVWPLGPPKGVPQISDALVQSPATPSTEVHVLGGSLLIHDARRWRGDAADRVPPDVNERDHASLTALIDRLEAFAREHGCVWTVLFANEEIGQITARGADDGVAIGLMGEWKNELDRRRFERN